jgi:UDP-N-acetylglucosamine 3-dehydrogenase
LGDVVQRDFDHAVVCTPPRTHYDIVKLLLESGKHVFVEKPLATSSKQCRELLDIARDRRLKLQCGYIERFNPIIQKMRKEEPSKFMTFVRENTYQPHIQDNIVVDTAVHDIDLAMTFFGCKPHSVKSSYEQDYCSIIMDFPNGTASINCSWTHLGKVRSINNVSTIHSFDILKDELTWFLESDPIINVDWGALWVQEVVEEIVERS